MDEDFVVVMDDEREVVFFGVGIMFRVFSLMPWPGRQSAQGGTFATYSVRGLINYVGYFYNLYSPCILIPIV